MTPPVQKNGVISAGDIQTRIAQDTKVHFNLGQDCIVTTEDKLRIILMKCYDKLEAEKAWMAPAGILITIIAVLVTANFKDVLGLKSAVWQALFIFIGVSCLGLLIRALLRSKKAPSIDEIVSDIKQSVDQKAALGGFSPDIWKIIGSHSPDEATADFYRPSSDFYKLDKK